MKRIGTPTAVADKFGPGKPGFTDGIPGFQVATDLEAAQFDHFQEELCAIVEGEGFTLDPAKRDQVYTAIKGMFQRQGAVVNSITALRALPKTGAQRAFATDYYADGDGGGGGEYRLKYAVAPDGWHNGGTQITADDGAGWEMIVRAPISVKQFGARVGQDSTAAIQAAMNALVAVDISGGDFLCSGVTAPASFNRITGDGALLASANGVTVLQLLADTSRIHTKSLSGGFRIRANGKSAVAGLKIGSTTNNPSPGAQEAVLYLHMADVVIDNCDVGLSSNVTMEKTCQNVVLRSNTVGMKLFGDAINGGGNANSLIGMRFQGNVVGAMLVSKSNYPLHNNQFIGGTFQGNTVCGLYAHGFNGSGAVSGLTVSGAHVEGNGTGAASVTIDGYTIKRSDFHFVQTTAALENMDLASSLSPSVIAENNSVVAARNLTGYGATNGQIYSCDDTSVVYEYGLAIGLGVKTVESYGELASISNLAVIGAPKINIGLYRNDSTMPNPAIPLLDNTTGVITTSTNKDAMYGLVSSVQFAASPGSSSSNRNYWYGGDGTAGEYFLNSVLAKSSVDTTIRFQTLLDGTYKTFDVAFKANKWRRIIVTGKLVSTTGLQIYCYPTDSAGATLSFKGHQYLHDADVSVINDAYRDARVGVKTMHYESHTAAPNFGTWARGEIVWNSAPSAGGTPAWIVTTAGTSGTWKAMANLAD